MGKLRPRGDRETRGPSELIFLSTGAGSGPTRGTGGAHVAGRAGRSRCSGPSGRRARLLAAWRLVQQTGWASPAHLLGAAHPQRATAARRTALRTAPPTLGGLRADPPSPAWRRRPGAEPDRRCPGCWTAPTASAKPHLGGPIPVTRPKSSCLVLPQPGPRRPARASERGCSLGERALEPPVPVWLAKGQPAITCGGPTVCQAQAKRFLALAFINPHYGPDNENNSVMFDPAGSGGCLSPCPLAFLSPGIRKDCGSLADVPHGILLHPSHMARAVLCPQTHPASTPAFLLGVPDTGSWGRGGRFFLEHRLHACGPPFEDLWGEQTPFSVPSPHLSSTLPLL